MVVENGDTAFVSIRFLVGFLSGKRNQYEEDSKDFVAGCSVWQA